MEPDFSGYVTKAGLKCSDGRTITPEAFKHMNGSTVPLVWRHDHDSAENVLGHVVLEHRNDGVYGKGYFNDTKQGQNAKALVQHKDITAMSIFANQLVEKAKSVLHGMIREVSLVLAGANPGALIDYVRVAHSDDPNDVTVLDDEAVIYTGLTFQHEDAKVEEKKTETKEEKTEETVEHDGSTVRDVYDAMTEEQKAVLNYMVGAALQAAANNAAHSDNKNEGDLEHQEGTDDMTKRTNVFEQQQGGEQKEQHTLTHDAMKGIVADAVKRGSLKAAVEAYALEHGINDIDILFPDAKTIGNTPDFNKRRTEWVANVLNSTRHSPFSRVKSIVADLTQDDARAKGYIKGSYKKEEWFGLTSRITTPTTVYKKQALDRDDVLDITDFDVVAWLKAEMRLMLEEELARAILIGDGRDPGDEDKVKDPGAAAEGAGIRAIANENELYATTVYINLGDASSSYTEVVESVMRARRFFKGTGTPTFYTTAQTLVEMMLTKDTLGRRLWNNKAELAAALMVADIVEVEVMDQESDILGIIVNLQDYNVGADRGGEINMFDDFDIDYNKQKYLIETRISGALVRIKSAMVLRTTTGTNVLVAPNDPTFVSSTGVVTIPSQTGVVYKNADTSATLSSGAQSALSAGATLNVVAVPASGYYFATSEEDTWSFTRPAA